jgi:hypothetical protein
VSGGVRFTTYDRRLINSASRSPGTTWWRGAIVASERTVRDEAALRSKAEAGSPADVAILTESLILAQDERWRRA